MPTNHLAGTAGRSSRKTDIIVIAALAIAVFAAVVIVGFLRHTMFTPQATAETYVKAIAQGHFDRANALADPGVEEQKRVLLSDAAYDSAGAITNVRLGDGTANLDGSVTFPVSYNVGGKMVKDGLTVAARGSAHLLFPSWTVVTPLVEQVSVSVPSSVGPVSVNGLTVTAANASRANQVGMTFKAYPGTYTFRLSGSKYIQPATAQSSTAGDVSGKTSTLEVKPTDTLTQIIQGKIDAWVDSCPQATSWNSGSCPFRYWGVGSWNASSYRDFSWTVTKRPQLSSVTFGDDNKFFTDYGEATVEFETTSIGHGWQKDTETERTIVGGTFTINGDDVRVDMSGNGTHHYG